MASEEQYQQYQLIHRNFSNIYAEVHQHIVDFYPQPKRFIEYTGPEIEKYEERFSFNGNLTTAGKYFEKLFCFSNNFGDFAIKASRLFSEFNALENESHAYLETSPEVAGNEPPVIDCNKLIPELTRLVDKLKEVKEKALITEKNLRKLESDWRTLKEKIK